MQLQINEYVTQLLRCIDTGTLTICWVCFHLVLLKMDNCYTFNNTHKSGPILIILDAES